MRFTSGMSRALEALEAVGPGWAHEAGTACPASEEEHRLLYALAAVLKAVEVPGWEAGPLSAEPARQLLAAVADEDSES